MSKSGTKSKIQNSVSPSKKDKVTLGGGKTDEIFNTSQQFISPNSVYNSNKPQMQLGSEHNDQVRYESSPSNSRQENQSQYNSANQVEDKIATAMKKVGNLNNKQMRESVINLKLQKQQIAANLMLNPAGSRKSISGEEGGVQIKRASVLFKQLGAVGGFVGGSSGGGDIEELQIENDRLKTTIMILNQKLKMKEDDGQQDSDRVKGELKRLKEQNKILEKNNSDYENKINELNQEIRNLQGNSNSSQSELKKRINELEGLNSELTQNLDERTKALNDFRKKTADEIADMQRAHLELVRKMQEEIKNLTAKAQEEQQSILAKANDERNELQSKMQEENQRHTKEYTSLCQKTSDEISFLTQTNEKLQDQINQLNGKQKACSQEIEEFLAEKANLMSKLDTLEETKQSLEISEKKLKDLNRQLEFQVDELMEQLDAADQARKQLKKEFGQANDKIIQLEEENYSVKNLQKECLAQLTAVEDELEESLNLNQKLQSQIKIASSQIYYAKKEDQVDKALGSYLNTFPEKEKLKIMFVRESEGVYQFGQKRIYIKVERGDQIMVRVGGGFMHINSFIDTFTNGEVDKIERHEPLQRLIQKLSIQRLAADKAVREQSPIRSPQRPNRSPDRKQN